jgi:hypothetical protein
MKTAVKVVVLVIACLSEAAALAPNSATQVIAAPDKGDELEGRAYVEEQKELEVEIDTRDPNATINTDIYR